MSESVNVTPILYTAPQTCELLGGMSRGWLQIQIRTGQLRPIKLGTRTMFHRDEIRRFLAERMGVAA